MKQRLGELMLLFCAIGVVLAWFTHSRVPELDWNLGRGRLRLDGISLGMTPREAFSAMGESGGERPEHVYSSADGRTLFLGGSIVIEVASFDCLNLPDGTKIRAGESMHKLASLWPMRHRPEKNGLAPFTIEVTKDGAWYEGAGELWVHVTRDGKIDYFDLSKEAARALGGPCLQYDKNGFPP